MLDIYNDVVIPGTFAQELIKSGGSIVTSDGSITASNPHRKLPCFDIDANDIPDSAMTLAVLALMCDGASVLRNIGSWRVKECDRISAMATELRKLGAEVIEGSDFIKIIPPKKLNDNVAIDTYNDHRMAMCFSLVCLMGVSVTINNPECVSKTFPDYFKLFAQITQNI